MTKRNNSKREKRILTLRSRGLSLREIGKLTKITHTAVKKALDRYAGQVETYPQFRVLKTGNLSDIL